MSSGGCDALDQDFSIIITKYPALYTRDMASVNFKQKLYLWELVYKVPGGTRYARNFKFKVKNIFQTGKKFIRRQTKLSSMDSAKWRLGVSVG